MANLNKHLVLSKLNNGELGTETCSGKSEIWKHFERVTMAEKPVDWVICSSCKEAFHHNPHSTGTSFLTQHFGKCKKTPSTSISSFFAPRKVPVLSLQDKRKVTDALVSMCSTDMRPFTAVSGSGFSEFAEAIYKIGYSHGRQDLPEVPICEMLPHRTTVSNALKEKAKKNRAAFKEFIVSKNMNRFAITLDFWTNEFSSDSYVTVTMHFISNFKLKWISLATRRFNQSKTSEVIVDFIKNLLEEFAVPENSFYAFVTDNASNLVKALENEIHIRCSCHCLNLAVRKSLELKEIEALISAAKKLVQHIKKTGLQSQLSLSLKQEVATRWNTVHSMLDSINENFEKLVSILITRNEMHLIFAIEKPLVEHLLHFLGQVKACSEELSGDKSPTLHLVVPWFFKLKNLSNVENGDIQSMKLFKNAFKCALEEKWNISTLHYIATFLHPKLKHLPFLSTCDKKKTFEEVRKILVTLGLGEQEPVDPPPAKMSKSVVSEFAPTIGTDEVDRYIECTIVSCENLLEWWSQNTADFPKLSKLASFILAIPASEATSERIFSASGRILEERRQNMEPDTLEAILFNKHFSQAF